MQVIEKQGLKVVGIQISASHDYLFTELPHVWKMFFEKHKEITNRIDTKFMNICLKKDDKTTTNLICVEVNDFGNIPEGMVMVDFPRYEYILHIHRGKLNCIEETICKMYKWADENGYSTSDFKIDYGYFKEERDPVEHTLLLRIV